MKSYYIYITIAVILILVFIRTKLRGDTYSILKTLLIQFEGFSSTPYFDVNRWSWGYGTKVPDSTSNPSNIPLVTIDKTTAMNDALNFCRDLESTLDKYLKVELTSKQMAALLSFAYNLGIGNGIRITSVINSGNMQSLKNSWLSYINVNGIPSETLRQRRGKEFALFQLG